MGDLIPFPKRKKRFSEEEIEEYNNLKELIQEASTWREFRHLRKRVNAFVKRVEERKKQE